MAHTITREELEKELSQLGLTKEAPDDSVRTSNEWREHWGCSQNKTLNLLKTAKKHGLIKVQQKSIMRVDDKSQVIAAYQFITRPKTKLKKTRRGK